MPYEIRKVGKKWGVFKKGTSKKFGTHDTRKEAAAQIAAIEASEKRKK